LRLDKLTQDAAAFRRANEIRDLVAAARAAVLRSRSIDEWCAQALELADSIDPVLSETVFDEPRELTWRYGPW
jgi:hypothetical protein